MQVYGDAQVVGPLQFVFLSEKAANNENDRDYSREAGTTTLAVVSLSCTVG